MDPLSVIFRPQLVRNHFFVPLPKKQQDYMVQPFGHFRCSLKRQNPDYLFSRLKLGWRRETIKAKKQSKHTASLNFD